MSLTERVIELVVWWTLTIAALAYIWHIMTNKRIEPRSIWEDSRGSTNTETTHERESA